MNEIELKAVEAKADELGRNLESVKKAIKAVQTRKCNLAKNKFQKDYDEKMLKILAEERLLVEVRQLLKPTDKKVPDYTQADVEKLDYDETLKAIKSIQSKKFHTRWLNEREGDNDEFRSACQIEEWLLEHKKQVRPVDDIYIRKSDLVTIIDTIKTTGDIKIETIIELLEELL